MEIKRIDAAAKADIRLKNEPFSLFGQMVPAYTDAHWSYEIRMNPPDEVSAMCFPDENYDFDAMGDCIFLGAYENGRCVGLAVLQHDCFRYLYLYDLKVNAAYRQQGVGTALLEKAKEVARAENYRGIYTIGQDNNLAACKFYLKTGFQIGGLNTHVYRGTSQEDKADIYFYLDI